MSLPIKFKVLYGANNAGEKYFSEEKEVTELKDNEILVKIEFAPLNPSDISVLQGWGKYGPLRPHPAGLEGSGTVYAVGPNLKVQHKVGDRVHVYAYGTYSEYVVAQADHCAPIKGDLSFEDAASHFINPGTVYYMGKLAEGHKAAIHTVGTSALGRILIRYFKKLGIKLINIVRRDDFNEELKAEGADYILNQNDADFEAKLKEIAYKENATFALDAINGDFSGKILRNMPPHSILYLYGSLSGKHYPTIFAWDLLKDRKLSALIIFDYVEELKEKGELKKFWEETHALLPTYFSTKLEKVFKLDHLEEALEHYNKFSSRGKILITPK